MNRDRRDRTQDAIAAWALIMAVVIIGLLVFT